MITIFRRIRQKLINSGTLTKYLFYATGEIALVMIGILLALQVNNWNEERAALNETRDYLAKKIDTLEEDREQLQKLYEYRVQLNKDCEIFLNKGIENTTDNEISDLVRTVTIERRFNSSFLKDLRDNTATYFRNIKGSGIDDTEQDYLDMIDIITFSESRLNIFSENLENDLWRSGFFTDNRAYFTENGPFDPDDVNNGEKPPFQIKEDHAIRSLMAIVRRNEISNKRLSGQYLTLLDLNAELRSIIQQFLDEQ